MYELHLRLKGLMLKNIYFFTKWPVSGATKNLMLTDKIDQKKQNKKQLKQEEFDYTNIKLKHDRIPLLSVV